MWSTLNRVAHLTAKALPIPSVEMRVHIDVFETYSFGKAVLRKNGR
jgi:hypothetical protein